MMGTFNLAMLGIAALLMLSVVANRISSVLRVPSLLVFIGIGMLAGSDGPGGLYFNNPSVVQMLGIVALSFILFAGGMETDFPSIKGHIAPALSLSTVGVVVTASIVAAAAHYGIGYSVPEGLLLGSILAATDAAAVFGQLRGRGIKLKEDVLGLVELESGSNDPMAVFLTLGAIAWITEPKFSASSLVPKFVLEMGVGLGIGYVVGRFGSFAQRRMRLGGEAIASVFSLALVLFAYSLASVSHGNGFLAVYVAGLVYGNMRAPIRKVLLSFHDALGWLMQIVMFLVLGLQVFPSHVLAVAPEGLFFAFVLAIVARPIGVLCALGPFRLPKATLGFMAWGGLRGAVPIVLATFPLLAGIKRSDEIFDIVFFVVLVSALVQGTTLPWVAQRLGLQESA